MQKLEEELPVLLWTDPENIEREAIEQIRQTASMPFLFRHVAVMPDCHYGKGATVGTVMATNGAIVPSAVGVDIGCGMIAVKTKLKREDIKDEAKLRHSIERAIPMSAGRNNTTLTPSAKKRIKRLENFAKSEMDKVGIKHYDKIDNNWRSTLGSLGGGNHFIELCTDQHNTVWVTLHSGSRGIGNKIGNIYIKMAQDICRKMFVKLPHPDLAYLPEGSEEFKNYIRDLLWAQEFALLNREEMMDRVMGELSYYLGKSKRSYSWLQDERINCHHNFARIENHFDKNVWVTRKGAIRASVDDLAMIPGSMGTGSYIVRGLGNKMSFESAPHGAGRRMSRNKAREQFTKEDLQKVMAGIEYRDSENLVDEIPMAYKDIDRVIEDAKELVEVLYVLKQFINMKGD